MRVKKFKESFCFNYSIVFLGRECCDGGVLWRRVLWCGCCGGAGAVAVRVLWCGCCGGECCGGAGAVVVRVLWW
ncbi:hypothetical protein MNL11_06975 [Bartonella krasnovii]|uniref:hypothetical protein n=1 Tax=Bartonella krasnovii TaxID=2267275 RepID=UPI001F4C5565|nr:hypothetical protein [Bartonella krasnovii]UNF36817.1 hypothetical protein MNL11_06975 [Bartonella krasnovii]